MGQWWVKELEIKNRSKRERRSYGIEISSERMHLHNRNGSDRVVIKDIIEGMRTATEVKVKLNI